MAPPRLRPGTHGQITATKRGDRWMGWAQVRYRGGEQVKAKRFRRTKREALDAITAWAETECKKISPADLADDAGLSDQSTVGELVARYMDDVEDDWSEATRRQYRSTAKKHLGAVADLKLIEVSPAVLTDAFKSSGPGAWRSARAVLGGAWKWALAAGTVTTPSPVVSTKAAPRSGGTGDVSTAEAIKAFVGACAAYSKGKGLKGPSGPRIQYLQFMVPVSLGAATRVGELLRMRWEVLARVDESGVPIEGAAWDDESVGMATALTIHMTKAKRKGEESRPRRVTLPGFAITALREWWETQPVDMGWVWPTSNGTAMASAQVHTAWRKVRKHSGLEDPESFHTLRRTAATWVGSATTLETAERMLGHKGSSVAEIHYVRPELVDTADIMQRRWDK